ncbi:MAG: GbsR/MarR family transcriptional regulator [Xanthomarina gelatinilytica]|uniref:GbsR/MarR family transcriptional regulator n=1 Tax=Xanthomarina gelatinilytica TaxID=1137281 RepID=UPI003A86DD6D
MSNAIKLTEKEIGLLGRLAFISEAGGLPPMSAKVIALLTVSPVVGLTFDQIKDTLGVSKSAISTALTHLQGLQQVEYSTPLGERKRIFKPATKDMENFFINFLKKLKELSSLYEEILDARPKDTVEFNNSIRKKIETLSLFNDALKAAMV